MGFGPYARRMIAAASIKKQETIGRSVDAEQFFMLAKSFQLTIDFDPCV
jgi:hypothetical protein